VLIAGIVLARAVYTLHVSVNFQHQKDQRFFWSPDYYFTRLSSRLN